MGMRDLRGTVRAWAVVLAAAVAVASASPGAASDGPEPDGGTVDGFAIGYVPGPLARDTQVEASDAAYEWGGAAFTARLWERALPDGGFRVEMQVLVVRGEALSGPEELRTFLAEYHERRPEAWALEEFDHAGSPGFAGEAEVFWLQEPGVAVEVRDSAGVLGREEIERTALGITPDRP